MLRSYATWSVGALFIGIAAFVTLAVTLDTSHEIRAAASLAVLLAALAVVGLNAMIATGILWVRDGTLNRRALVIFGAIAFAIWLVGFGVETRKKSREEADELHMVAESTKWAGMTDEQFLAAITDANWLALRDRMRVLGDRACLQAPGPTQDELLKEVGQRFRGDEASVVKRLAIENCNDAGGKQRVQAWYDHYAPQKP